MEANGIRLNYLDWGGSGPTLILLHGAGSNPHYFDDLAPAFIQRFRVLAYARRGHGRSAVQPPYDTATLTEDLRGLMDSLGIARAHLAGHSMGGNEITRMAGSHPDRVDRIVYLDGGYDMGDPDFMKALQGFPLLAGPPSATLTSLDAYRAKARVLMPGVEDASRFEAWLRDDLEMQPDGSVRERERGGVSQGFAAALRERRDYTRILAPTLAVYSESFGDIRYGDPIRIAENLEWNRKSWAPFRKASVERVRRELRGVRILEVPGAHDDFVFTCRDQVVAAMLRFLPRSKSRNPGS